MLLSACLWISRILRAIFCVEFVYCSIKVCHLQTWCHASCTHWGTLEGQLRQQGPPLFSGSHVYHLVLMPCPQLMKSHWVERISTEGWWCGQWSEPEACESKAHPAVESDWWHRRSAAVPVGIIGNTAWSRGNRAEHRGPSQYKDVISPV